MMRRVLSLTVVALSACQQPAKTCAMNSECPAGSQCVESLCVQNSGTGGGAGGGTAGGTVVAGGSAGSMGGGGGGNSAGGSSVGGGVAGGAAAGQAGGASGGGAAGGMAGGAAGGMAGGGGIVCSCMPWQTCAENGRCDDGTLTVIAPVDGFEVAPDGSIPVQALMLQFDGGTWSGAAIPLSTSLNVMGSVDSGVPGTTPAGGQTQFVTVRFGWPSSSMINRTVSVVDCARRAANLQPYEECSPTVDGGAAFNAGYVVEWLAPDAGARLNGSSVPAQVRVSKPDGGLVAVTQVPVSPSGTLMGTGGSGLSAVYSGTLTLSGVDGTKTFVAGWPDGGPRATASLSVERDTLPPTVALNAMTRSTLLPVADPLLPSAWVKDEIAYVSLTVNDSTRSPTAGDVAGLGFNALSSTAAGNCGTCVAPNCICVAVDLKDAPLESLRGDAGFTVDAGAFVDSAGNQSLIQIAQMGVTRVKWLRLLARPTGSLFVAAPAVDTQGNLYVGASNNIDNVGSLISLHPIDGGIRWQNASLGAVQALATANSTTQTAGLQDLAYVASNEDNTGTKIGRLRAVRADDGGVGGLSASICQDAARPMFSAPALVVVGGGSAGNSQQVGALGIFNSVTSPTAVSGEGCIYRPANGAQSSVQKPEFALPEVPTPASSVANIVSTGTTHFSVNSDFSIESWTWTSTMGLSANGGLGRISGPTQTGLLVLGGGPGSFPLLTTQISSTPLSAIGAGLMNPASIGASGFTRASPAVVLPGMGSSVFVLAGGDDSGGGGWLRLSQVSLSVSSMPTFIGTPQAVSSLPAGIESLPTSPIYGDANQVYVVTRGGRLFVLNATTSGLTFAWSAQLTAQGDVLAHPTLDCNRSRPGAPGVLYSISSQGTVSAVVVDSRRLGSSVWPKWQRTAGNAGSVGSASTDFPLNPGCN